MKIRTLLNIMQIDKSINETIGGERVLEEFLDQEVRIKVKECEGSTFEAELIDVYDEKDGYTLLAKQKRI